MFSISNPATPEALYAEANTIQSFLEAHYEADNPEACVSRGNELEIYIARTGKMLADAKFLQDDFINSSTMATLKEALKNSDMWSASLINKKVSALCKDYNYLVNWIERLNRTATHQLDFTRTIISKQKAEMQMNNYGNFK